MTELGGLYVELLIMSVKELELAVSKLSFQELASFAQLFEEFWLIN